MYERDYSRETFVFDSFYEQMLPTALTSLGQRDGCRFGQDSPLLNREWLLP